MIPSPLDAALRLRLQTETDQLQPLHRIAEIAADLPELKPGQTFTARIETALPERSYLARVGGQRITLQLPASAQPGDEMELVVVGRAGKLVIARQVEAIHQAPDENAPYAFTRLSPTARLIAQLLPASGRSAPPAPLGQGAPLLAAPPAAPQAAVALAPILAQAVKESGVFYEAHQAQWITGRLPVETLLKEPQGRHSATPPAPAAQAPAPPTTASAPDIAAANERPAAAEPPRATLAALPQIPDELRPLVQQQLEAAASQRVLWHGEVWPRQSLDWEIARDERRSAPDTPAETHWLTKLSLTLPRLGPVDARLRLGARGVEIALDTAADSVAAVRAAAPQLAGALGRAGVPLLDFQVQVAHAAAAAAR